MSSTTEAAQAASPLPCRSAFRAALRRIVLCGAASLAFFICTERGLQLIVRAAGRLAACKTLC
uniref:hypothetical protein n=1 Tax=Candidatus Electronema sp. TaxID=2698783 RepID=UPI004056049A